MKLRKLIINSVLFMTVALSSSHASSALLDVDVTFNGTDITLDMGSDTALGTMITVGDSFNYNIGTAGNDFWQVDITTSYFPFLAFTIAEVGDRDGIFSLDLLLDGVSQFSLAPSSIINSTVHLGTNAVSLIAGLTFDEVILDYTLTGSTADSTILQYVIGGASPNVPGGFTTGISYNVGTAVGVPTPTTLLILGLGLVGSSLSRRNKA